MTITLPPTTAPTVQEIYDSSELNWRKLDIPDAEALEEPWLEALAYLGVMTGRYFDDWPAPTSFEGAQPMSATPGLAPLMRQATRMRIEQIVKQKQPGYVDTATDDLIASFSVTGYSETKRDPASLRGKDSKMLNPWPGLNDLLWSAMTPERYDYWTAMLTGVNEPAFLVQEVDWSLIGKDWLYGQASPYANPYAPWTMWY